MLGRLAQTSREGSGGVPARRLARRPEGEAEPELRGRLPPGRQPCDTRPPLRPGSLGTPSPDAYSSPSLVCAVGSPWSAALRYQSAACAKVLVYALPEGVAPAEVELRECLPLVGRPAVRTQPPRRSPGRCPDRRRRPVQDRVARPRRRARHGIEGPPAWRHWTSGRPRGVRAARSAVAGLRRRLARSLWSARARPALSQPGGQNDRNERRSPLHRTPPESAPGVSRSELYTGARSDSPAPSSDTPSSKVARRVQRCSPPRWPAIPARHTR